MDNKKDSRNFVGYEYKEVTISQNLESVYIDGYPNFGWIIEDVSASLPVGSVTLKMKRDRKIRNKAELVRLQRKFESDVAETETLEHSKYIKASVFAYVLGIIGTAFMAGSVFAVTGGQVLLCIVLAVPAFLGWVLPYFIYRRTVQSKTSEISPLIESKYDEIYDVCEKANQLS